MLRNKNEGGVNVHHAIPERWSRYARDLGYDVSIDGVPGLVLTIEEHVALEKLLKEAIPHRGLQGDPLKYLDDLAIKYGETKFPQLKKVVKAFRLTVKKK